VVVNGDASGGAMMVLPDLYMIEMWCKVARREP